MLRRIISKPILEPTFQVCRYSIRNRSGDSNKDEAILRENISLPGAHLDEIDEIMADVAMSNLSTHYPNLEIGPKTRKTPINGHQLMVIQPWVAYTNFDGYTDPDLQLEECVSLGNTIHNWKVVDKKILFSRQLNRKNLLHPRHFEELKEQILARQGISAIFFGVELLSGIQLSSLEKELKLPIYDRFTVVLNIFRQHARTKEAKIQLALAEVPYIRSHLREIHESSEYSSTADSMKMLIGGSKERVFHKSIEMLRRREKRLKELLEDLRKQRVLTRKLRTTSKMPIVSVVGYTNSGKTSLIKYLTDDQRLMPEDRLFATLDVTAHSGQLPSCKTVIYMDTVGFLSRIPLLLVEAFSATLQEVQQSDLIIHVLDISHPDHKLQYSTVMKALSALKVPKRLLDSKITVGNKVDKLQGKVTDKELPKCDLKISIKPPSNLSSLVDLMDKQLISNLKHGFVLMRVENGGNKYAWLRKNGTILEAIPDQDDGNYLICRIVMSPVAAGRWRKQFGTSDIISDDGELSMVDDLDHNPDPWNSEVTEKT